MIYFKLFWTFFKIGAFTFGGGYAMIPLIQSELIKNGWMGMEELVNFIAVSESTPGPFAVNIATYVGTETAGIGGAACATLGVVMPSFIIILIVSRCYMAFRENKAVAGCMKGLRPAVVGLIASAFVSIGQTAFFPKGIKISELISGRFIFLAAVFAAAVFLIYKKKHPILIIILSALFGILGGVFGFY